MLRSHHRYVLQVSFSSGMSSGLMNVGVWAFCSVGMRGSLLVGRDIDVVSMVLTLGWGVRGLLVCLTSSRFSSGLLFSVGFSLGVAIRAM